MAKINPKAIFFVAKKEFQDNLRNRWIIALTIVFIILTIAMSFLAGAQEESTASLGDMEETVILIVSVASMLIPLIAIMLGYASISGEAENGSLYVLLAYPVKRIEVILQSSILFYHEKYLKNVRLNEGNIFKKEIFTICGK